MILNIDYNSYYVESTIKSDIMELYKLATPLIRRRFIKLLDISYDISDLEYGGDVKFALKISKNLSIQEFNEKLKELKWKT